MTFVRDRAPAQLPTTTPDDAPSNTLAKPLWILNRFHITEAGILGELFIPNFHKTLFTIERPWRGNERFVSCIPEGIYNLAPHKGERWPSAIRLEDVPNRSGILIHPALRVSHVKGCIGVGYDWGIAEHDNGHNPYLAGHTAAFNELMGYWEELIKRDPYQRIQVTGPVAYAVRGWYKE